MDRSKLVWLDLCSGLGGASQPALDRGWTVWRVDIDPRFKPDIVADVRALPLKPFHVDVLWASPPCQEFSKFGLRCFFPDPPEPDLSIIDAVIKVIVDLKPRFWMVENVRAARRWLSPRLGPAHSVHTGHVLYSNFAFLLPNIAPRKGAIRTGRIYKDKKPGWGPLNHTGPRGDAHERAAVIPYEIGEAICLAVERRLIDNEEQGVR